MPRTVIDHLKTFSWERLVFCFVRDVFASKERKCINNKVVKTPQKASLGLRLREMENFIHTAMAASAKAYFTNGTAFMARSITFNGSLLSSCFVSAFSIGSFA